MPSWMTVVAVRFVVLTAEYCHDLPSWTSFLWINTKSITLPDHRFSYLTSQENPDG